jgi:hypothetical protein
MDLKFGADHHVAILKARSAEFQALRMLRRRDALTPLVEIVGKKAPKAKRAIERSVASLSQAWSDRPFFLDLFYSTANRLSINGVRHFPIEYAMGLCERHALKAIPVTGPNYRRAFQSTLRNLRAKDDDICFRVGQHFVASQARLDEAIGTLLKFFKVSPEQVHLVLDYDRAQNWKANRVCGNFVGVLNRLPMIERWKTITTAAASFPSTTSGFKRQVWQKIPRSDWFGWLGIRGSNAKRYPAFGDYCGVAVDPPAEGMRCPIFVQMRYTTNKFILVWKGDNIFDEPGTNRQIYRAAAELVARQEFRKRNRDGSFCTGDEMIMALSTSQGSAGGAQKWRTIWTNHHLEQVAEGLASLPYAGLPC